MSILGACGSRLTRPMRLWLVIAVFCAILYALAHPSTRGYYDTKHLFTKPPRPGRQGLGPLVSNTAKGGTAKFPSESRHPLPGSPEAHTFWAEYANVLLRANTTFDFVREKDNLTGYPMITYHGMNPWDPRQDRLNMTDSELAELTEKHAIAVDGFREIASNLPFVPGTRGIVVTTSVEAMAFLTVSLRMLRKTGTTLPVEVWVYDRDVFGWNPYGIKVCQDVWPQLDATCRFMEDYLPEKRPAPLDEEPHTFQNKLDAMIFSTFEQFLFLDNDNFPIMSVDDIFDEEPFTNHGLVLWPDYWADTSSHYWYEIAGVPAEPLFTRASTESGQVLVNKQTHAAALLMSSYYVRYGRRHYFQLFTQAAMGMGDKESYLKGALVYDLPFYQVAEVPERLGYRCDGNERAIASGQHHPRDDYFNIKHGIDRGRGTLLSDGSIARILFIHGNLPKYDPARYLDWYNEETWNDQLRCNKGRGVAHRMYGDPALMKLKFGWDVEKAIWDQMRWVACEYEEYMVQWWNGTDYNVYTPRKNVCRDMISFYNELLTGPEGLQYDDSLTNPYEEGGLFEQGLRQGTNKGWQLVRSGAHWW